MSDTGIRHPLGMIRVLADQVVCALAPFCERIETAGSIRRERPFCGDVAVVAVPREGQRDALIAQVKQLIQAIDNKEGMQ